MVQTDLNAVVSFIARYGDGLFEKNTAEKASDAPGNGGTNDMLNNWYDEAMNLISQKNYIPACQVLKKLVDGGYPEFAPKSSFEIGRCFFLMGKYNECIKYYTQMIAKYPKHDSLGETLFFMGQSHEKTGNNVHAIGFYKKSLVVINDKDNGIYINAARALKKLER
jgi:TolA-binding protein